MKLPKVFWYDPVLTATYIINRLFTHVLNFKFAIEVLLDSFNPFFIPPEVFGCVCFVHVPKVDRFKLDPKALKCLFGIHC